MSFETLEHLEDQAGLLKEFRRVLEPGGFLLISSPDKSVYTDRYHNENEFHVRELYQDEFEELIAGQFPVHRLLRQKLLFHSAIWSDEPGSECIYQQADDNEISSLPRPGHDAMYFIAICAADKSALPVLNGQLWLFDDAVESVYQHYHHEIRKNMSAGNLLADMEREMEQLKSRLKDQPTDSGGCFLVASPVPQFLICVLNLASSIRVIIVNYNAAETISCLYSVRPCGGPGNRYHALRQCIQ